MDSVCRPIVCLLQEVFLEHANLRVRFSLLLTQNPIVDKPCFFFHWDIFWVDGKLPSSEERVCFSEPQFPNP